MTEVGERYQHQRSKECWKRVETEIARPKKVRETKAEADGEGMGEGLDRASPTMFSGPGT